MEDSGLCLLSPLRRRENKSNLETLRSKKRGVHAVLFLQTFCNVSRLLTHFFQSCGQVAWRGIFRCYFEIKCCKVEQHFVTKLKLECCVRFVGSQSRTKSKGLLIGGRSLVEQAVPICTCGSVGPRTMPTDFSILESCREFLFVFCQFSVMDLEEQFRASVFDSEQ